MAGPGDHGGVVGQPFPSRRSPEVILHRLQEATASPGTLAVTLAVARVQQGDLLEGAVA